MEETTAASTEATTMALTEETTAAEMEEMMKAGLKEDGSPLAPIQGAEPELEHPDGLLLEETSRAETLRSSVLLQTKAPMDPASKAAWRTPQTA